MNVFHLSAPIMLDDTATFVIGLACIIAIHSLLTIWYLATHPRADVAGIPIGAQLSLENLRYGGLGSSQAAQMAGSLFFVAVFPGIFLAFAVRHVLSNPVLLVPSSAVVVALVFLVALLIARRRRARALGPAIDAIDVVETAVLRDPAGSYEPAARAADVALAPGFGLHVRLALKPEVTRKVRFQYRFALQDGEGVHLGETPPKSATLQPAGPTSLEVNGKFASDQPGTYYMKFLVDGRELAARPIEIGASR